MGEHFITRTELYNKPTAGAGWDFLLSRAGATWSTPTLADSSHGAVYTNALAAALSYARTCNVAHRTKVITAVRAICGTEGGSLLYLARTLYGYVMAADLVQMPLTTLCNNGETWGAFLGRIRTTVVPGNSRWSTLEVTSADSANNWGAYALSSHLAVSYVLGDDAAVQRDLNIFRRYLGDTTSPFNGFRPSAPYVHNNNGPSWDMTPTLQRGINPVGSHAASGAIIEDALRLTSGGDDSVPCCTVVASGAGYMEEALDGALSTAMLFRAHGIDVLSVGDQALRRAFVFYISSYGPRYSLFAWLPAATNYLYGTSYAESAETNVGRHLGFGQWLFA